MKDSYDHHAAIYFLLLDKLKEQKMSGGDGKRRRPSTIAEQPSKVLPVVEDFHSLRLRTGSESDRETAAAPGGGEKYFIAQKYFITEKYSLLFYN